MHKSELRPIARGPICAVSGVDSHQAAAGGNQQQRRAQGGKGELQAGHVGQQADQGRPCQDAGVADGGDGGNGQAGATVLGSVW